MKLWFDPDNDPQDQEYSWVRKLSTLEYWIQAEPRVISVPNKPEFASLAKTIRANKAIKLERH